MQKSANFSESVLPIFANHPGVTKVHHQHEEGITTAQLLWRGEDSLPSSDATAVADRCWPPGTAATAADFSVGSLEDRLSQASVKNYLKHF